MSSSEKLFNRNILIILVVTQFYPIMSQGIGGGIYQDVPNSNSYPNYDSSQFDNPQQYNSDPGYAQNPSDYQSDPYYNPHSVSNENPNYNSILNYDTESNFGGQPNYKLHPTSIQGAIQDANLNSNVSPTPTQGQPTPVSPSPSPSPIKPQAQQINPSILPNNLNQFQNNPNLLLNNPNAFQNNPNLLLNNPNAFQNNPNLLLNNPSLLLLNNQNPLQSNPNIPFTNPNIQLNNGNPQLNNFNPQLNNPNFQLNNLTGPAYQSGPGPAYQSGPGPAYQSGPGPAYQSGPGPAYQSGPGPAYQSGPGPAPQFNNQLQPQRQVKKVKKKKAPTGLRGALFRAMDSLQPENLMMTFRNMMSEGNVFVMENTGPLSMLFLGALSMDMMLRKYPLFDPNEEAKKDRNKKSIAPAPSSSSKRPDAEHFQMHTPFGSLDYVQNTLMDNFINFMFPKRKNWDSLDF